MLVFCTISVDARMHGDRLDPEFWSKFAENFPRTFFTIVVETAKDISQIVDFLETRDDINPAKIGMMGVSMGGFITLVSAFLEKRLEAAVSVIGPCPLRKNPCASWMKRRKNYIEIMIRLIISKNSP